MNEQKKRNRLAARRLAGKYRGHDFIVYCGQKIRRLSPREVAALQEHVDRVSDGVPAVHPLRLDILQ